MVEKGKQPPEPITKAPDPPTELPKPNGNRTTAEFIRGKIEPTEKK